MVWRHFSFSKLQSKAFKRLGICWSSVTLAWLESYKFWLRKKLTSMAEINGQQIFFFLENNVFQARYCELLAPLCLSLMFWNSIHFSFTCDDLCRGNDINTRIWHWGLFKHNQDDIFEAYRHFINLSRCPGWKQRQMRLSMQRCKWKAHFR